VRYRGTIIITNSVKHSVHNNIMKEIVYYRVKIPRPAVIGNKAVRPGSRPEDWGVGKIKHKRVLLL
jgi:hypothetical protein